MAWLMHERTAKTTIMPGVRFGALVTTCRRAAPGQQAGDDKQSQRKAKCLSTPRTLTGERPTLRIATCRRSAFGCRSRDRTFATNIPACSGLTG